MPAYAADTGETPYVRAACCIDRFSESTYEECHGQRRLLNQLHVAVVLVQAKDNFGRHQLGGVGSATHDGKPSGDSNPHVVHRACNVITSVPQQLSGCA